MAVCQLPILSLTISAAQHCLSVILKHFMSETFPIPNIRVCICCSYLVCFTNKKDRKGHFRMLQNNNSISVPTDCWLLFVVLLCIIYKKLVSNQNIMGIYILFISIYIRLKCCKQNRLQFAWFSNLHFPCRLHRKMIVYSKVWKLQSRVELKRARSWNWHEAPITSSSA